MLGGHQVRVRFDQWQQVEERHGEIVAAHAAASTSPGLSSVPVSGGSSSEWWVMALSGLSPSAKRIATATMRTTAMMRAMDSMSTDQGEVRGEEGEVAVSAGQMARERASTLSVRRSLRGNGITASWPLSR